VALKTKLVDLTPAKDRFRTKIKLLSGGYSDRETFKDGELMVYPWDTEVSEWFLERSRSVSGIALTRDILSRLTDVKPATKMDKFVASEALLVLLVSRALVTQHKISYQCKCTSCGRDQPQESVVVPDELEKLGEKGPDYPGYEDATLPDCGDVVRIRPLLIADELAIEARAPHARSRVSDGVARTLASIISVGGGTPDSIEELISYYRALSPSDVQYLEQSISDSSPQLNSKIKHVCGSCGKPFEFDLSFDATFFRPVRH
jgi:hypothetical protein